MTVIVRKINDIKRNMIYIHIPKCGGTTVTQQYRKYITENDFEKFYVKRGHITYDALIKSNLLDKEFIQDSFIWTTVRNPYALMYSFYIYERDQPSNSTQLFRLEAKEKSFKEFTFWFLTTYYNMNQQEKITYITDKYCQHHGVNNGHDIFYGQHYWLCDDNNKLYDNIKIFKLEDYDENYDKIAENIGLTIDKKRENVSSNTVNKSYRKHYDDDLKEFVYNHFKRDFELFNYEW